MKKDKSIIKIFTTGLWMIILFVVLIVFFRFILHKSIDINKSNYSEQLLIKAKEEIDKKNYNNGISKLSKVIQLDTGNYFALLYRGKLYYELNKHRESLQDLNKIITNNQSFYEAYLYRGNIFNIENDYQNALQDYNKSIDIASNPEAWLGIANVYLKMTDTTSAIAYLDKAIELFPSYAETYYVKGCLFWEMNKQNEAVFNLEKSIQLGKNAPKFY